MKYSLESITLLKNNQKFQTLIDALSPYTRRIYFVGGFCRDLFLGIDCDDVDIEVYGIDERIFDEIMGSIGAKGIGKSFFVYKFFNFDVALARIENKISNSHNGFEVKVCNDEKIGASRRDFRMNSIMINVFSGEILDFYGGINDIKNKKISLIIKEKFKEDSLRVLRAIQFSARFDFDIDTTTLEVLKEIPIDNLSMQRIRAELFKFFRSKNLAKGLKLIYEIEIFKELFLSDLSDDKFIEIYDFLQNHYIDNEMFFLYVITGFLSINKKELLRHLEISNKLFLHQEFHKSITPKDLIRLSLIMPLKDWLGMYESKRIEMAKKLGIYDKKFSLNLSDFDPKTQDINDYKNRQIDIFLSQIS